jgi:hypothetical protein
MTPTSADRAFGDFMDIRSMPWSAVPSDENDDAPGHISALDNRCRHEGDL